MEIAEIEAMPVGGMAADDCVLWLWATNSHLREAFSVVEAWGFEYKTLLTWDKMRIGLGDYLRGQTEHCLLAIKGRPALSPGAHSTLLAAPAGVHSAKPDVFYSLVETLCAGRRAELFQRTQREGWTGHGDEVPRIA
jgi:N6-adenosine-specific RNA methylase IME4